MVYNPIWLQVTLYILIAGLFCLTASLFSWAALIIVETEITGAVPVLFFTGVIGYVAIITRTLIKYIPAKLTYDEKGFSVGLKGSLSQYSWSDISSSKTHGISRVFQLFDHESKIIYVVCFFTPGYKDFEQRVNHRTNLAQSN